LILGWFYLSALFSDSFRRSMNSTNSVNSVLLGKFDRKHPLVF